MLRGGDIIFKKEIDNYAFAVGRTHKKKGILQYYELKKDKYGWHILQTRYNINKNSLCLSDNNVNLEKAYIMSNDNNNLHGIFIIPRKQEEKVVKSFKDSKGNTFKVVYYDELLLGDKMIRKPVFFGVVKGELDNDYYVQIYKEKYYLGKYKKGCVG